MGVEPHEIGLDEQIGGRARVVGGNGERPEDRRREAAERLTGDAFVVHGRPAWGTSTCIMRMTPVAL